MAYGSILNASIDSSEFNNAILKITGPKAGSTVTVTQGNTVINAIENNGVWTAEVGKGSWVVSCTMSGLTDTKTVVIDSYKIYNVVLEFLPDNLDDASWTKISDARKAGVIGNFYSVGACKKVTFNGNSIIYSNTTIGTMNFSCYATLVDISSSHLTFQLGQYDNSNSTASAFIDGYYGGFAPKRGSWGLAMCGNGYLQGGTYTSWSNCWLRNYVLGASGPSSSNSSSQRTMYWAFPSDLRNKMISVSVHSCYYKTSSYSSDYISIPSEYEVTGKIQYYGTHSGESQFSYYKSGNSKIRRAIAISNNGVYGNYGVTYWTRTWVRQDEYDNESNYGIQTIGPSGTATYSVETGGFSYGVTPIFFI